MRKITVDGNEYKWIVGKKFVHIKCPEIKFSLIFSKYQTGHAASRRCWCGSSGCEYAEQGHSITPADIRKIILEQNKLQRA